MVTRPCQRHQKYILFFVMPQRRSRPSQRWKRHSQSRFSALRVALSQNTRLSSPLMPRISSSFPLRNCSDDCFTDTQNCRLYFSLAYRYIHVHDTQSGARLRTLKGHTQEVTCLALNPRNPQQVHLFCFDISRKYSNLFFSLSPVDEQFS